jgi:hypothetical protein
VRDVDARCPFCGAEIAASVRPPRLPARRLGRAATFAFGAVLAASACSDTNGPGADASNDQDAGTGGDAAVIEDAGATRDDAGVDSGPPDAGTDSGGGVAPPYGAPPPRAD